MKMYKWFLGALACFFLIFFSFARGEALAACPTDPVKIAGYAYTAPTIQEAYDYASFTLNLPSFTLQLTGQVFEENVNVHGGAVEFDGGYDCSFVSKTSPSSILGTITIKSSGSLISTVNTESTKVVSSAQCAFDNDADGFTSIGSCSGSAFDCDDNNPDTYPNAPEICDGFDNDCNGEVDEGLPFIDADGDGYISSDSCGAVEYDCNDNNADINPGAEDIPYDGIDQDCNGSDLILAEIEDCESCHGVGPHNKNLAPNVSCSLCHATTVSNFLTGHYGDTVRTAGNNMTVGNRIDCFSCHDADTIANPGGTHDGPKLGNGSNFVWNKVLAAWTNNNLTCDSCHETRDSLHATATAHNNRVIDSTCANCHTSDTSVLGSPGNGTLAGAADVDTLHGVISSTTCAVCHNYNGTLLNKAIVLNAIQQGLNGTQVSCLDCHTDKATNHGAFEHPVEVGPNDLSYDAPGQPCSDCHDVANWAEIEGTEHNVTTNGAGSCATCHNSTRQEVIDTIAAAVNPTHCLDCHSDKDLTPHGSVDHVSTTYVTGGATFCLDCHDPGGAVNGTVDVTHGGDCTLCHTTIPALQPGVPAGGGDCVTCHTVTWQVLHMTNPPDHSTLVTTSGTNNCASCHADALIDASTHLSNCTNCHEAADGALLSSAVGKDFTIGGNCETCHTDTWEATHTNNTPDHGILVRVAATSCADCHIDPPPLTDAGDPKVHNTCGSCHNVNGSSRSLAIGQTLTIGGDCTTCHTTGFDSIHATSHTHTVAMDAGDLSYDPPGTPCGDCHVVANWTEIEGTEHNVATNGAGSCATCHNSTRQEVIDAIALGADPTNCLDCHSDKNLTVHGSTDHVATGDVTLAIACANCHDDSAQGANWTIDFTHTANCTLCHTTVPNLQPGVPAGGGDCDVCHPGAWNVTHTSNTPDHTSLVQVAATDCASCHDNTLVSGAADTHLTDCSNCHDIDSSLVGTAVGKDFTTGGDCTTCHGSSWGTLHTTTPDHSSLVTTTGTDNCDSCHADALIDATTHLSNCSNCHNTTTGSLLSSAAGKDFTIGGNCQTCHTDTWEAMHFDNNNFTFSHTLLVQVAATDCANCHSDPPLLTDAGDAKVHDACASCHNANGSLVTTLGTNNQDFTTGGSCVTCHTGRDWTDHNIDHATDGYVTLHSECTSCHATTMTAGAGFVDPANNGKHDACTTCHAANGAISVTVNDCSECHSSETGDWTTHAQDHTLQVTQQTACSSCHSATVDYAAFVDPANDVKHDDCYVCHDNTTKLASATVGDCSQCHTANYFDSHTHTHDVSYNPLVDTSQTTQQGCALCHNDSAGNLATFADIVTEHGTCSRCHDYTDDGNGTPPQPTVESTIATGTGVTCATCHTPKVPDVDHGVDHIGSGYVTGEAACLVCHTDPATTFTDPANAKIHDDCATCHDPGTNALVGSAIGNEGGPNTCTTCHTGRDWTDHNIDHATDGYVTLHSECTSCHATTMTAGAGFVDPANNGKHDACTTCHAANGAISVTVNDCSECHSSETGDWTTHAQDHTLQVTQQTACSSCHSATVDYAAFVDPANDVKHDDCYVCHDNTTKLASATVGDCSQCHTANYFDSHTHTHDVSYNPLVDTSQTTQQGCALCHNDSAGNLATFADIVTEHGTCSRCHDYTDDGNGTPPQPTVESTIATGTGVTCATCHTPKVPDVDHGVDHIGSGYVTGEAACLVCHTDPATTFTDPANAKIHDDCATCHDPGTNALVGSAIGNEGGPNTCTTCHTGRDWTDHNIDHATDGYVTLHSECTSCHATTMTAGAGFVDPANNGKHDACTTCHAANGAISVTVNDCSECHSSETGDWTTHAQDHTLQVTQQTACSSCHSATVDYAAFVDPANDVKHDDCYVCHDNTTKLASAAAGDCSQCHTDTWEATHSTNTPNHNSLVQVATTDCASCHSDPPPLTDAGDATVHNACGSCHTANGALQSIAVGQDFTTGGDCTTCHGSDWGALHTTTPDHSSLVTTTGTDNCASCHEDQLAGATATTHLTDCSNCHDANGALISSAIGKDFTTGGNCQTCHTDAWQTTHTTSTPDHTSLVQVAATDCASCHDNTLASGAADTHLSDCSNCHAANGSLVGTAVGQDFTTGGDCTTCHGSNWGTLHTTTPDHSALVTTSGTNNCATCHEDQLDGATATTHLTDCSNCHNAADGSLVTTLGTNTQTFGVGGNCETCHTSGWTTTHTTSTPDHTSLVQVAATDCASCHDNTLASAAADTHLTDCSNCHSTNGSLVGTAVGKDFTTGGDCTTCHGSNNWGTVHTTAPDHSNLVKSTGTDCASCHDNTLASVAPETHLTDCSNCHSTTTGLLTTTLGTDTQTFTTGGDCTTCHGTSWGPLHAANTPDHSNLVQVAATDCASCHDNTLASAAADTHLTDCSNCHNANGSLVTTLGTDTQTFATGGDCTTCHGSNNWGTVHTTAPDHSNLVKSTGTDCASCHDNTLASVAPETHLTDCSNCHSTTTGLLTTTLGTDTQTFATGGDCTTCHGTSWGPLHATAPDHTSLVQVAATDCASCHDNTLASGAADTHLSDCSNCHAANGSLVGTAVGQDFTTGGDCTTCHGSNWGTLHTTTPDHSALVTTSGTNNCATCHEDQLDGATATTHLTDCSNCHNAADGSLVTTLGTNTQTFGVGGNCETCHTSGWTTTHTTSTPDHTSLVQVAATDCASCHDNTLASAAADTHLTDCSNCHSTNGSLVGTAVGKDFTTGGDCTTCHGSNNWGTVHTTAPDHSNLVKSTGTDCASCHDNTLASVAPETHLTDCSNCHSTTTGLLTTTLGTDTQTFTTGGDCTTCHGTSWGPLHAANTPDHSNLVQVAATDCASCHDNTLASAAADTHLTDCSNCHNANGSLVTTLGTDTQTFATGGDCTTCHGSNNWGTVHTTAPDHSNLVKSTGTDCASCHDNTLASVAPETHLTDCSNCHSTTTGLLTTTLGTDTQTFATGGDCTTCHGTSWGPLHATAPDHTSLVQVAATDCASCHDNTLASGAADTHLSDCSNCHAANGSLVGTAVGQDFTTGGDCTTCHGSNWGTLHTTTPDHSALVTTSGTNNCATCHEDQLDGATATTHLTDCSNCHNAADGSLVTTLGTNTQTFGVGGNCETCHTSGWTTTHTTSTPDHTSLVQVAATDCASCHDNTLASAAADTHLTDCSNCHSTNGSLVGTAVGKDFTTGGDCTTCHGSNNWGTVHTTAPDHSNLVKSTGTDCASCHDNTLASVAPETHLTDCSNCHSTTTGLLTTTLGTDTQTFTTGGDCTTCHGTSWGPLHAANTPDHSNLVQVAATDCASCHDNTLASAAADTHLTDCSNCHNANGSLVTTLGTDTQTFATGGDCTTCHGSNNWGTVHTTAPDHSNLVKSTGTDCASCHDNTLASVAPETHLTDCSNCHSTTTGLLTTTLGTDTQTFATGGDCTTCHGTAWESLHFANHNGTSTHNSLVQVAATSCAGCHVDPPPLTDNADNEVHNACGSCHATNGSLISTAVGKDFTTGGDCTTCHGTPYHTSNTCSSCHGGGSDADNFANDGVPSQINTGTEWASYGHGNDASTGFVTNANGSDPCLWCHDVTSGHEIDDTNAFRLKGNNVLGNGWNDACLVCHDSDATTSYDAGEAGFTGIDRSTVTKVDKWHQMPAHAASGNNGGDFCWDCHDPHGDASNIKMIQSRPAQTTDGTYGIPTTQVATDVVFSDNTLATGAGGWAMASGNFAQGVCNACHTASATNPKMEHYNSSGSDGHYSSNVCSSCHDHSGDTVNNGDAFKGAGSCSSCHAYPPDPGDGLDNTGGDYLGSVGGKGAHVKHVNHIATLAGVTLDAENDTYGDATTVAVCGVCHDMTGGAHETEGGTRNINFNGTNTYQFGPSAPAWSAPGCSNISCHFKATPDWE